MKSLLTVLVTSFVLSAGACHKDLNPGRCNSTSDCPAGQTCDLTQNGVCVCNSAGCMDGGGQGGGGTAGGMGGMAGTGGTAGRSVDGGQDADASTPCSTCTSPKSVCLNRACVECASNADCTMTPTKPICDTATNTCRKCAADSECPAEPGVCMAHQDGRCATVPETIYVATVTGCSDSAPGTGTVANPFCSMPPVGNALSATRDLVVVRGAVMAGMWTFSGQGSTQTTFVGQQPPVGHPLAQIVGGLAPSLTISIGSAFVRDLELTSGSAAAVNVTGGNVSLQNVTLDKSDDGIDVSAGTVTIVSSTISTNSAVGINATGGTVNLSKVTVDRCLGGGILLNSAAFDIENTTVTNDGPSPDDTLGGIRIQNPPSGGPAQLNLLTVQTNDPSGISCSAQVQGTGILASGNVSAQITPTCGFSSCGAAPSTTCGAQ